MKPELDSMLCEKYPKIFRDRRADKRTTAMCWGFECGDGWYDLIDDLCSKLQKYCDEIGEQVVATQVKEKFATLRFYTDVGSDAVYALIHEAEVRSSKTCEVCGKEGETYGGGWLRTLCKTHATEAGQMLTLREVNEIMEDGAEEYYKEGRGMQ